MSGFNKMNEFELLLDHQRREIARVTGCYFPYTVLGCTCARQLLDRHGISVSPKLTGWEIVHLANKELKQYKELRS